MAKDAAKRRKVMEEADNYENDPTSPPSDLKPPISSRRSRAKSLSADVWNDITLWLNFPFGSYEWDVIIGWFTERYDGHKIHGSFVKHAQQPMLPPKSLQFSVLPLQRAHSKISLRLQPVLLSSKIPPRGLQSQIDMSVSPVENSSLNASGASSNSKKIVPSYAIISFEIIVSPLKHEGYYAAELSYYVSAPPVKSSSEKMNKSEHFGGSCSAWSSEEPVAVERSPSTTYGEAEGSFTSIFLF
ncbi:uncharacterized protein A4U43_C07F570 [Asparagus officinalis]|uniref:Uncharacterized protein n=1 Tax=Asparagus officinalis TaxID=4686 RepID=A0A5P1EBL5_ASPOF|nr:uncharacterized protein A4U43_C07F570 [Asparagus officinalis]